MTFKSKFQLNCTEKVQDHWIAKWGSDPKYVTVGATRQQAFDRLVSLFNQHNLA